MIDCWPALLVCPLALYPKATIRLEGIVRDSFDTLIVLCEIATFFFWYHCIVRKESHTLLWMKSTKGYRYSEWNRRTVIFVPDETNTLITREHTVLNNTQRLLIKITDAYRIPAKNHSQTRHNIFSNLTTWTMFPNGQFRHDVNV